MTRKTSEKKCYTAQAARDIIRKARKRVFMLAVHSEQRIEGKPNQYYPGFGHIEVSRKTLLRKLLHHKEGRYSMFSKVVSGKALVQMEDTGRIIFIG